MKVKGTFQFDHLFRENATDSESLKLYIRYDVYERVLRESGPHGSIPKYSSCIVIF